MAVARKLLHRRKIFPGNEMIRNCETASLDELRCQLDDAINTHTILDAIEQSAEQRVEVTISLD